MAYLGRTPVFGEIIVLNSIESQFNGSTTSFSLTRQFGGSPIAFFPASSEQLLVSLGGVIQKVDRTGNEGFTTNADQIIFAIPPVAGTKCFIISYGGVLDIGTPGDNTVTEEKILDGSVTPAKLSTGGPYWDTNENFGIGTSSPASLLNIKGTTPRLTIGDSQSKTWTVGDTLSSIDFSSDDTSCGGTTDKVRTRIETYVADTFGCSHGLGFYAVDIVDGVLRKHITIGSRGELTLGHSRKNQTQIIALTQNSSTFYPIELRDTYNGTGGNNSILFSSTLSDNTTLYNSASIGVLSSDKGTGGSGSIVLSTKSTNDSDAVERVRVTSTGFVGIGTTVPTATLTVGLLSASQPALSITNGFNQNTITITRNGGTGSSFKASGPHFGPSIDI